MSLKKKKKACEMTTLLLKDCTNQGSSGNQQFSKPVFSSIHEKANKSVAHNELQ